MEKVISRAHVLVAIAALTGFGAGCGYTGNPVSPSVGQIGATQSISSTTGPALASSAGPHDVPLKGRLEGFYTLSFPGPLELAVTGEGTGNATQLGQFTFEYDELVDLTTGTGEGTYVLTAANGDTLTATWTGLGFPTSDPNVLSIIENATVTGGTGRFADAAGSFIVERLFNFTINSGPGAFEGTVQLR
jgi:hypothetical protein